MSKLESFLTMQLETPPEFQRKMREELEDVGVERFNREHNELLEAFLKFETLMEKFRQNLDDDADWEQVAQTLKFLQDYAHRHLEAEEAALERAGFDDLPFHKIQHGVFTRRLNDYDDALTARDAPAILGLKYDLFDWFFNHINKEDVKYRDLLKGQAL